ncbi:unnamed protein product [Symbiodinium sp. CCMP2456]|nr:unnamed protein product [Symbiodinium sp. CCMP2456]
MAEGAGFRVQAFDKSYGDKRASRKGKRSCMDLNSNAGMVIAISLVLRSKLDQLVAAFGVVCSSFVPINRGTSKRSFLCPHGDESVVGVRRGNKLMARSTILMYLVIAAGGHYVLENPQGSLIALHNRYVQFLRTLLACGVTTYKVSMWMRKFQSFTWKRTWLWSSSDLIYRLDLGPLTEEEKANSVKTVTRTTQNGKECWTANDKLKPTQLLR